MGYDMETKRNEIKNTIRDVKSLPTLPGVVIKLTTLADNDKATLEEMSRLISSDQVLSAKVLRLVNSPFYGFPGRVSTVSHALILLGVNVVKGLAISSSIFDMMEKNTVGLWEHSLGCGVASSIITRKLNVPEGEEVATAALLHDLGKVIMKMKLQEDFGQLEALIQKEQMPMNEAEKQLFDTDHAEIGEWLTKSWFLPEKLVEPIACHHNVEKSVTHRTKTAVVHLADVLIKANGFGFSGDEFVPKIQPVAWQALNLTEQLMEEIIIEIEDKLVEVKNFSLEVQSTDDHKV